MCIHTLIRTYIYMMLYGLFALFVFASLVSILKKNLN